MRSWWRGAHNTRAPSDIVRQDSPEKMAASLQSLIGFVRKRLSSLDDVALRLATGALAMIGASWLFGKIALDLVTGAPLVIVDTSVANWLHRHPHEVLTQFMLAITHVHGIAGIAALTLATAAFLLWRKYWYWLLALAVSVPGGMLLNVLLKYAYHRVRPSFDDPLLTLGTYSFPSGHTASTTLFYGFLAVFLVSRVKAWRWRVAICVLALLMIALVGLSRMYLGVHYLSDVIAAFAAMLAWLATCLTSVDALRRRRAGRRLIA